MTAGGAHGGLWLRALRLRAGMTIETVAATAATSPEYLAAIEAGTSTAAPSFLYHVARIIAAELQEDDGLQEPSSGEGSPAPSG